MSNREPLKRLQLNGNRHLVAPFSHRLVRKSGKEKNESMPRRRTPSSSSNKNRRRVRGGGLSTLWKNSGSKSSFSPQIHLFNSPAFSAVVGSRESSSVVHRENALLTKENSRLRQELSQLRLRHVEMEFITAMAEADAVVLRNQLDQREERQRYVVYGNSISVSPAPFFLCVSASLAQIGIFAADHESCREFKTRQTKTKRQHRPLLWTISNFTPTIGASHAPRLAM